MKRPDISVCLPVYNGREHILQAIDSLLAQTFSGILEVIVSDDASTDDTLSIAIDALAASNLKYSILRSSRNIGLVGNWNRCLGAAQGHYVAFLFQDDWMERDFLKEMYRAAEEAGVGLAICDREYQFSSSVSARRRRFLEVDLPRLSHTLREECVVDPSLISRIAAKDFLGPNFLGEPIAGLVHRDLIENFGKFDSDYRQICDFEYWLRLTTNTAFVFIPSRLVNFRVHHESTSARNSGSSVSLVDRLILGHRMLSDPVYANFRSSVDTERLWEAYRKKLQTAFLRRSYFDIAEHLPTDVLSGEVQRFNPGPTAVALHFVKRSLKAFRGRITSFK